MHNILSPNEISAIVNDPVVKTNKANLSNGQNVVRFSFPLTEEIRAKLSHRLAINVPSTVPMRWIKGDTPLHVDKGEKQFSKTHLIYLTDNIGELIIDGQSYPIAAGDAHIFSEGLAHCTVNTGTTSARLMIGPMSEMGFGVGRAAVSYFNNQTDAETDTNSIGYSDYTLLTIDTISSWFIYKNENFGGGATPTPDGGPYNAGYELVNNGVYWVYPYISPPQIPARPLFYGSLFTNNAQVYYKSHSLSTGSGGSGVRNVRHKQRKT